MTWLPHLFVKPDATVDFRRAKGFELVKLTTVGLGLGNNVWPGFSNRMSQTWV